MAHGLLVPMTLVEERPRRPKAAGERERGASSVDEGTLVRVRRTQVHASHVEAIAHIDTASSMLRLLEEAP